MATPTRELVGALRATAARLRTGSRYQWTHMGACNCGHLAQTVTHLTPAQIHAYATERAGDWTDQAQEFCGGTGYPIDAILESLMALGLDAYDIGNLERLSDTAVLRAMPDPGEPVDHRRREHVVLYMETWAALLEARVVAGERTQVAGRRTAA